MTATSNPNDLPAVLDQVHQAEPDLLRPMLTAFVQALMSADADAACGAEYGTGARTAETTQRLPAAGVGYPGRHDRAGDTEAPGGVLLPRPAPGAPQTGRTSPDFGRGDHLSAGVSTRRMEKWSSSSASPGSRSPRSA